MSDDPISNQYELLAAFRRTLHTCLKQYAILGSAYAPPALVYSIEEARRGIRDCKEKLRHLGAPVENEPDDNDVAVTTSADPRMKAPPVKNMHEMSHPSRNEQRRFERLLTSFREGRCVFILGSDLSSEVRIPSPEDLGAELAEELDGSPTSDTFYAVAQQFEAQFGRPELIKRIRQKIDNHTDFGRANSYDLIAELVKARFIRTCVTLTWDDQIERALRRKSLDQINIVTLEQNGGAVTQADCTLIRLYGDLLSHISEAILTQDDLQQLCEQLGETASLGRILWPPGSQPILVFIGCRPHEQATSALCTHAVKAKLPHPYALCSPLYPSDGHIWEQFKAQVITTHPHDFLRNIFRETCQFVNRKHDVAILLDPNGSTLTEINGWAGCGKTELLREVDRQRRAHGWRSVLLDLGGEGTRTRVEDTLDLAHVIGERLALAQLGSREQLLSAARQGATADTPVDEASVVVAASAQLVERIAESVRHRQMLFLIDSVEHSTRPDLLHWLIGELVPALMRAIRSSGGTIRDQLRVVLASRYPVNWEKLGYEIGTAEQPQPHTCTLTSLEEESVIEMLTTFAALEVSSLDPGTAMLMGRRIHQITHGHPRAIKGILKELAGYRFDIEVSATGPDFFSRHAQRLFAAHVQPVIKQILERDLPELPQRHKILHDALHQLSVIRRLDLYLLPQLVLIDPQYHRTPILLLRDLQLTRLVEQSGSCFVIDQTVRRLLAADLALTRAAEYLDLHRCAFAAYDRVLRKQLDKPLMGELQIAYVVESMYHQLTLAEYDMTAAERSDVTAALIALLNVYLPHLSAFGSTPTLQAQELRTRLLADLEWMSLANRLLGPGLRSALDAAIDQFIRHADE